MPEETHETLENALLTEAVALSQRIEAQSDQAERLRTLADRIEKKTDEDRNALSELEGVLGEAGQLRIDDLDQRLRGQRLERVAIRLLQEQPRHLKDIHYREWFELVRKAGYKVPGKNPLGTFLAQLNRSDAVEPVGHRSGRYRLRAAS